MKLNKRKKVPSNPTTGIPSDTLHLAKNGDDVRLFIVSGGVTYEVTMLKRIEVASGSGGSNDHGLLTGLSDDDHTQYTQKATLTTKGDIYVATAASTPARKAAGTNNYPLVADSAQADGLRYGGDVTMSGALFHTGSTKGSYNVGPVARPAAYTQTYSTATRTHANPTATSLTDSSGGTANDTLVDVTTLGLADPVKVNDNFADVSAKINALIVDLANAKQVLNQMLDDFQLEGSLQ